MGTSDPSAPDPNCQKCGGTGMLRLTSTHASACSCRIGDSVRIPRNADYCIGHLEHDIKPDLYRERRAQVAKFGDQAHPDGCLRWHRLATYLEADARYELKAHDKPNWTAILLEEVGEAIQAGSKSPEELRAELVQVMAVCGAWIHDIDHRPGGRADREEGA